MTGPIPAELGLLPGLVNIDLDNNALVKTIPEEIAALSKLENFFVSGNALTGRIPSSWSSSIRNINLSNNSLEGSFVMHSRMEALEGLAIDHNHLTGEITLDKKRFPKLEQAYLSHNFFTGSLEENETLASPRLQYIDISHNKLHGSIPAHLVNNLSELRVLSIGHNDFTGKIPEILQENTQLTMLAMPQVKLSTPQRMPSSIGNLRALKHLDLSNTYVAGAVPEVWGKQLTQLERLFLAGTDCEGLSLDWLKNFHNLKEVSLKNSGHAGTIPDLSPLANLTLLDLDSGYLSGPLPSSLGKLRKLRFLFLSGNSFTGEVPTSILELPALGTSLIWYLHNSLYFVLPQLICLVASFLLLFLDVDLLSLERNGDLEGSICKTAGAPVSSLEGVLLYADCQVCPCCSQCCTKEDWRCHYNPSVSSYEPAWQTGYKRQEYTFGSDVTFPVGSE